MPHPRVSNPCAFGLGPDRWQERPYRGFGCRLVTMLTGGTDSRYIVRIVRFRRRKAPFTRSREVRRIAVDIPARRFHERSLTLCACRRSVSAWREPPVTRYAAYRPTRRRTSIVHRPIIGPPIVGHEMSSSSNSAPVRDPARAPWPVRCSGARTRVRRGCGPLPGR
jgi:hypothetical protein